MTIVARRSYYLLNDRSQEIELQIFEPFKDQGLKDFRSEIKIVVGNEVLDESFGIGIDSLTAIQRSIDMSKTMIESLNRSEFNGNLRWLSDDSVELGF